MTDVLILAAGLGTRMKSQRAKVLHELGGSPLIAYAVRAAWEMSPETILTVTGHQAEQVETAVREEARRASASGTKPPPQLLFQLQAEQRGTGHAVMSAAAQLKALAGPLLVLAGDVPLIKASTLDKLRATHSAEQNAATVMTVELDDPTGYGRIIRRDGRFVRSVEQKDASADEQTIREINVSIYCFEINALLEALQSLTTDNAQGEYYLTDVPAIILAAGQRVGLLKHDDAQELLGVNTRVELADLERELRHQKLRSLMLSGVTVVDPSTTYIHSGVEVGEDTIIHPQVIIEGASRIGAGCEIQSWSRLRNVVIEDGVIIKNSCVLEDSTIRRGASVGPFARLRSNADIGEKAGIGNFVEVKKSKLGRGTKASHLTYLGDATLGDRVNVGAGTVTCNYDGVRKNETIIEDEVRIGSDTMLVAPVRVGRGAMTGAGSVVTKDVPPDSLVAGVPAAVKKRLK